MKAAYTGTNYRGSLSFDCRGHSWQSERAAPLGLTVIPRGESLLAIPSDASGGMRGGDRHEYRLRLSEGAEVQWSAPASTLFHSSLNKDAPCEIETLISVDGNSELIWLSKPNIPGAQSHADQRTSIDIAAGSEFLYSEFWAPGRDGEHWGFNSIHSRLELSLDGHLRFKENWTLSPNSGIDPTRHDDYSSGPPMFPRSLPAGPAGLNDCRMWGLVLINGPRSRTLADEIIAQLKTNGAMVERSDLDDTLALARVLLPEPIDPIWKNLARIE